MRLNRFFGDFDFQQKTLRISDRDFLHQVKNVLRLDMGQELVLVDGQRQEAIVKIAKKGKDYMEVEILEIRQNENESARRVILYCSILKRENFELVAQKATEVGVSEIAPMVCQRTIKTGLKYERLRKIIKEATEQSGRGFMPVLHKEVDFKEAIADARENETNILFDLSGANIRLSDSLILALQENARVGIFIGPEGGWSKEEIEAAKVAGFKIISLGQLTLRAETSAVVAAYIVSQNWG